MKRLIIVVTIILALLLLAFTVNPGKEKEANNSNTQATSNTSEVLEDVTLAIGETVPDFEFLTLEGDAIHLSDYDGKIIMLNFWATWCPYCIEEMPDLEEMNTYDDVVVLALNSGESVATVNAYLEEHPYDFEILVDEDRYFSDMFLVKAFPTTFFINEAGILLGSMPGMMTIDQMEAIIKDIRDGKL